MVGLIFESIIYDICLDSLRADWKKWGAGFFLLLFKCGCNTSQKYEGIKKKNTEKGSEER